MTSDPHTNPEPRLLLEDLPCASCGFNLRGLSTDRDCPDCGAPIARSLPGLIASETAPAATEHRATPPAPAASAAPPTAPRPRPTALITPKSRRGFALVLIAAGAEIALAVLAQVIGVGLAPMLGQVIWVAFIALTTCAMVARIVQARGWWLLTARDAFGPPLDNAPDLRRGLCRATVTVHLIFSIIHSVSWIGLNVLAMLQGSWPVNFAGVHSVPVFLEGVLGAVAFLAKMLFIARLGGWIASPGLVRAAMLWMWLGPLLVVVGRAWGTFSRMTGLSWLAFTGTRFDVLFPPLFWFVGAIAAWLVVRRARNDLAKRAR